MSKREHPLDKSRQIIERIVIEGKLILKTPTHFGNGDTNGTTDMPLLLDETDSSALLLGTSITGALRNYVRERVFGFGREQADPEAVTMLFGFVGQEEDEGEQSCLIVDDALGGVPKIELRDGVRIDPETRTAKIDEKGKGYKFDLQLLQPGTAFDLRFELLVSQDHHPDLIRWLAVALDALANEKIALGLRKRRGFGRCFVREWTVTQLDIRKPEALLAWIAEGHPEWTTAAKPQSGANIANLLGVSIDDMLDARRLFTMKAKFALKSSLLIRSGFGQDDLGPDMVHLHTTQWDNPKKRVPVLSGTSLAGVLRGRAMRIVRTLTLATDKNQLPPSITELINDIFGPDEIATDNLNMRASRLITYETKVEGGTSLVQNRIRIDRFTGGAYHSALFSQQPLFGNDSGSVTVNLTLQSPSEGEVGLLLLLLKDLWTGDLPLGGEASVGRGRLRGIYAELDWNGQRWKLRQKSANAPLRIDGDRNVLEACVSKLREVIS
ncbi:MAG: RAMP superfamily CRISPR-associated protein [Ardenticatenaceae bacterium]